MVFSHSVLRRLWLLSAYSSSRMRLTRYAAMILASRSVHVLSHYSLAPGAGYGTRVSHDPTALLTIDQRCDLVTRQLDVIKFTCRSRAWSFRSRRVFEVDNWTQAQIPKARMAESVFASRIRFSTGFLVRVLHNFGLPHGILQLTLLLKTAEILVHTCRSR